MQKVGYISSESASNISSARLHLYQATANVSPDEKQAARQVVIRRYEFDIGAAKYNFFEIDGNPILAGYRQFLPMSRNNTLYWLLDGTSIRQFVKIQDLEGVSELPLCGLYGL